MRLLTLVTCLAGAGLLAACGGSSSDSPQSSAPTTPTTPTSITLTGVVAKGAALADATVTAKCATGTGTVTSSSTGAYTITITSGSLPCVLEATSSDAATVLHSVATGSASSATATANITTLTELLVAQLTGQLPVTYMAAVDIGTLATAVTSGNVTTAQTAVLATLTSAGVDSSVIGNLLTDPLVAATSSTAGNPYDLVLDSLQATITSAGTTLGELTATIAAMAPDPVALPNDPVETSDTNTLPADMLLKPRASNCAALRSTSYRIMKFAPSVTTDPSDPVTAVETMSFDAATLTATIGPGDTWVWTEGTQACHFQSAGADIVVSPSGVFVARAEIGVDDDTTSAGGSIRMVIGVPVQNHTVANLAGTWNVLGWDSNNSIWGVNAGTAVVNSAGAFTSVRCFDENISTVEASCATDTATLPVFSVNAGGGFDLTSTDASEPWKDRTIAYRAGNGDLMLVFLNAQGEFSLATKYRALGVPAVNGVQTGWNVMVDTGLIASNLLSATTNTILTSDASTGTYTRESQTVGSSVSVVQSLASNVSRNGYTHRTGEAVLDSNGNAATVREMYAMRLRGMGMSVFYLPNTLTNGNSNARLGLSVGQ